MTEALEAILDLILGGVILIVIGKALAPMIGINLMSLGRFAIVAGVALGIFVIIAGIVSLLS